MCRALHQIFVMKTIQHYVHFHGAPTKGKILMVASSPAVSAQTGWPIGFWAAELTHPLRVFQEAGDRIILGFLKIRFPKIHGWVFDIHSGRLIDLKLDTEHEFREIRSIYDLKPL